MCFLHVVITMSLDTHSQAGIRQMWACYFEGTLFGAVSRDPPIVNYIFVVGGSNIRDKPLFLKISNSSPCFQRVEISGGIPAVLGSSGIPKPSFGSAQARRMLCGVPLGFTQPFMETQRRFNRRL